MSLTAEEVGESLRTHLMGEGLYVTDCERHDGALHVGYESMAVSDGVPSAEVGTVLRLLLDLAGIETAGRDVAGIAEAGSWDPEDVHVWVFEDPGSQAERGRIEEDEAEGEDSVSRDEKDETEGEGSAEAGSRGRREAAGERPGTDGAVGSGDRTQKGHYEVREGWFHALREGYLSETDFSTLVLSTLG